MFPVRHRRLARIAVTVAAAAALVGTGFVAHAALEPDRPGGDVSTAAAPVIFTGNGVSAVDIVTSDEYQSFSGPTWTPIAGSSVSVSVPSGPWRIANATFAGQTSCAGTPAAAYCSVRIVARKSGSVAWSELYPRGNWAIDAVSSPSPETDFWEGNSVERSKTLAPGTWTVRAEARTSVDTTSLDVAAWHLKVMLFAR